MDIARAVVLGIVQGLTEFLPVSSDGHLLLVRHVFGWPDEGLAFDAALHLGTFLALLVFFRATWWRLLRALVGRGARDDRLLIGLIALATVPGALAGYLGESLIGGQLRTLTVTGIGFLASAAFLFAADAIVARRRSPSGEQRVAWRQAFTIGVLQMLALLPGLSRSGSTIAGGMIVGLSRPAAVEFSFLLALPIVGGAGLKGLIDVADAGTSHLGAVAVGFLCAFIAGWWAIRFLLAYVRRHTFTPFAIYLVLVAGVAFLLS